MLNFVMTSVIQMKGSRRKVAAQLQKRMTIELTTNESVHSKRFLWEFIWKKQNKPLLKSNKQSAREPDIRRRRSSGEEGGAGLVQDHVRIAAALRQAGAPSHNMRVTRLDHGVARLLLGGARWQQQHDLRGGGQELSKSSTYGRREGFTRSWPHRADEQCYVTSHATTRQNGCQPV